MEKEKKLLKAIGDIDEKFIEEAKPEKVVRIAAKRSWKPLGIMAAAAVIILGLGVFMKMNVNDKTAAMMAPAGAEEAAAPNISANGSDEAAQEKSYDTLSGNSEQNTGNEQIPVEAAEGEAHEPANIRAFSAEEDAPGAEEKSAVADNGVQSRMMIANPWKDSDSLSEAKADAGFDMTIPENVNSFIPKIYRSIKNEMLEIIYCDADDQEVFRIRKAPGTEDISGDYNVYENEKDISAGDKTIHIKENGTDVFVASWEKDNFSFAVVIAENNHFTETDITKLVEEIS
ncbi:hypothetical protein BXO88_10530 [Oribacterium sp. C9]|uniref:hypothetical protein n=1 Tax=Oribacterium sp. C9 TaxID=1943579 RepID=UPI00098F454B|nr:hypothetical protein [Oribacterium sp. C9]OON85864.1 hypothetical protein BXO88_10530 [Oribacterium sp. C9]